MCSQDMPLAIGAADGGVTGNSDRYGATVLGNRVRAQWPQEQGYLPEVARSIMIDNHRTLVDYREPVRSGERLRITGSLLSGTLKFVLQLRNNPDFKSVDFAGRQADSFQIFICFNRKTLNPSVPDLVDVIIRGEEIHSLNRIPVRDARPRERQRSAGGWGAVRGTLPYTVHREKFQTVLIFEAPFYMLGVNRLTHRSFAYQFDIYRFGATAYSERGVYP